MISELGTARDLERVRYVTKNYERLQGLKMLPIGLVWFAFGARYWFHSGWLEFLTSSLILVALALRPIMRGYYEYMFGRVECRPMSRRTLTITLIVVPVAIISIVFTNIGSYVVAFMRYAEQSSVNMILLISGMLALVVTLVVHWSERHFRMHYMVLASLGVAMSFLPLLGVLTDHMLSAFLFLGLYTVVGGVFDHLLLVRTMKRLPKEDDSAIR